MTSHCSKQKGNFLRYRLQRVARCDWATRLPQSVFPTSVCRGSRRSWPKGKSRHFPVHRMIRAIFKSACRCSRAIRAGHWWMSGALPENVNYAVKSSFLLGFLESVPDVSAKLKAPVTADRKFEDVVKSAQAAAVLVLVY